VKKIISYSLWGNDPKYCVGAVKNALLRGQIYPDWISRFYLHKNVPKQYKDELLKIESTEIIIKESDPNWAFTTERFKAIDDKDVERVIFRDTDSRLNPREKSAVDEWEKQGTCLHVMKDHPHHASFPILAGMWGLFKNGGVGNMTNYLLQYDQMNPQIYYHYDQIFLSLLWNNLKNDCTIHDEFFLKIPFPTSRESGQFVGQVFDENDNSPEEHIEALMNYFK
tara:strand:+ start:100 stop:771 length:672 start_codon:yes stop_codon:yes gene_type:complete